MRHVVEPGENLKRLGNFYGSSVERIVELNGLGRRRTIIIGETLVVPTVVPAPPTSITNFKKEKKEDVELLKPPQKGSSSSFSFVMDQKIGEAVKFLPFSTSFYIGLGTAFFAMKLVGFGKGRGENVEITTNPNAKNMNSSVSDESTQQRRQKLVGGEKNKKDVSSASRTTTKKATIKDVTSASAVAQKPPGPLQRVEKQQDRQKQQKQQRKQRKERQRQPSPPQSLKQQQQQITEEKERDIGKEDEKVTTKIPPQPAAPLEKFKDWLDDDMTRQNFETSIQDFKGKLSAAQAALEDLEKKMGKK